RLRAAAEVAGRQPRPDVDRALPAGIGTGPLATHRSSSSPRARHVDPLAGGTSLSLWAGTPPQISPAGTFLVTTLPAAITALSPTVTPGRSTLPAPTHTLSPIWMPVFVSSQGVT